MAAEGEAAMQDRDPFLAPVRVDVDFIFPRPKSHYRTGKNAHILREDAPNYHTSTPDLDKLQRAIGDALTGSVVRDDKQIAVWSVTKTYGAKAGADITVAPLVGGAHSERSSSADSSHPADPGGVPPGGGRTTEGN